MRAFILGSPRLAAWWVDAHVGAWFISHTIFQHIFPNHCLCPSEHMALGPRPGLLAWHLEGDALHFSQVDLQSCFIDCAPLRWQGMPSPSWPPPSRLNTKLQLAGTSLNHCVSVFFLQIPVTLHKSGLVTYLFGDIPV